MQKEVSNYTRIGNTENPNLVVSDVFSAVEITPKTNYMTSAASRINEPKTQDDGRCL